MKVRFLAIDASVLAIGLAFAAGAMAQTATSKLDGAQYLKDARVSLQQARESALKVYSGTIIDQELEKERGGSGLRYSFVVKQGTSEHEVGIDAVSGKVLENSVEGPDAD